MLRCHALQCFTVLIYASCTVEPRYFRFGSFSKDYFELLHEYSEVVKPFEGKHTYGSSYCLKLRERSEVVGV